MNYLATETQAQPAIIKTFIEPAEIKELRKSLKETLSGYRTDICLDIAAMLDQCLCVELADAVKLLPVITSINTVKFLSLVKSKYDFGSTFEHILATKVSKVNLALQENKNKYSLTNVPYNQKHLVPFYISGNSSDESYNAIAGVCTHVSIESEALSCLVFFYGMRVEHAKQVYGSFKRG